jgi:hypothetical protein
LHWFLEVRIEIRSMKYWLIALAVILFSCGGSLSDEQRKKIREDMEAHKIMRVTDAQITEEAFSKGRSIIKTLEGFGRDSAKIDSLLNSSKGRIHWLAPGSSNAVELEKQLIDAYIASEGGSVQDNVQKIRNKDGESDSLLYTKPIVKKLPDGVEKLEGVWNIWLSKKELILAMGKEKK